MHPGHCNHQLKVSVFIDLAHKQLQDPEVGTTSCHDADLPPLAHFSPRMELLGRLTSLSYKSSATFNSMRGQSRYISRRCIGVHAGRVWNPASLDRLISSSR